MCREVHADSEEAGHQGPPGTCESWSLTRSEVPQLVWWTVGDLIGRFLYLLVPGSDAAASRLEVTLALGVIPDIMLLGGKVYPYTSLYQVTSLSDRAVQQVQWPHHAGV